MGELQPRMRAGDRDRQRVVELLGKHFGEGRLTVEEFDERVVKAHAAVHLDELPALTADLPVEPAPRPPPERRPTGAPPALVFLMAILLAWSLVVAVVHGAPPLLAVLVLFLLLLRHRSRRRSRHW